MTATSGTGDQRVYRLALLSNAMHQDNYARAFARHPRLRIALVVDEPGQEPYVAARNRALAALYDVPYVESLDALTGEAIDVISIGAQIERRARLAAVVAPYGKPLWLDKPPARTATEAAMVVEALAAAGVPALIYSHIAAPWASALREALLDGEIGDLLALHLDFHFAKGDACGLAGRRVPSGTGPREIWTFRDPAAATDPTESSHNVIAKREIAEIGWYPLALVHFLCPQLVRRVYATAGAYFFPEHRDLGLEDFATLNLSLDGGPVVTISTGRTGRHSHPAGRMAVRAAGTHGTLALDGGQPAIRVYGGAVPTASEAARPRSHFLDSGQAAGGTTRPRGHVPAWGDSTGTGALVDHFVACLDGTATPLLTARDAYEIMRVIDAAYESVASGEPVDLRQP